MSQVRRGTVLSFSSSDWTALVMLDGSEQESQIPVGQWVPATQLSANVECAVLIFDDTNTDDAVVLGAYGAVGTSDTPTFSALNIGTATGATAGTVRIGTTTANYGSVLEAALAGYASIAVRSSNASGVAVILAANSSSEARIGTASNHAVHFYVNAAASAILSASGALNLNNASGKLSVNGTQVVNSRKTGWGVPTATLSRTAITNADTLAQTISHLAALVTDLTTHGLIGA